MLEGQQLAIHAERDRKIEQARQERVHKLDVQRNVGYYKSIRPENKAMLESNLSAVSLSKASAVDTGCNPQVVATPLTCL